MRSKLNARGAGASSSIYWDSVDSSGSGSSGSGSRNYVDPWDLENYAYLRRHSIAAAAATATPQPVYQTSNSRAGYVASSRLSHHSPVEPDYWYAPPIREPGYDAPGSVEEIYFRPPPPRPVSSGCYYHQPIYEDEAMSLHHHYAAPIPLYSQLSELEQAEALEELRTRDMLRRRSKPSRVRNYQREECYYHRRSSELLTATEMSVDDGIGIIGRSRRIMEDELAVDEAAMDVALRYREAVHKPPHMTLSPYGHLKIDYTDSWNSLHRKIASKIASK